MLEFLVPLRSPARVLCGRGHLSLGAPRHRTTLIRTVEISLGLAPIMVDRLYETLREISGRGVSMIVIEQNVERGLALTDHVAGGSPVAALPSPVQPGQA